MRRIALALIITLASIAAALGAALFMTGEASAVTIGTDLPLITVPPTTAPTIHFIPCAYVTLDGRHVDCEGFVYDGKPQLSDDKCIGLPRGIAACLSARRGIDVNCVYMIVDHEDPEWNPQRWNAQGSGAYGLGQDLPPSKMAVVGPDYMTNPRTQLIFLIDFYAPDNYGSICAAAWHDVTYGTY